MSSRTRCHSPAWFPGGPIGTTGVSSRTRRASLRVGSSDGTSVGGGRGGGRLEQVGVHALLAARHDDGPVGGVAVHHDGLLAREHPLGGLAAGPGAHGAERLAVALLADGDGAAAGAGGEVAQQLGGAEGAGRQRGGHGRGEERTGQRDAAHLLEHDARLEEAGTDATLVLGDEEAGPAEVDQGRPEAGRDPGVVVGQLAQQCGTALALERGRATSSSASCSSSYVKSTALPWASPELRRLRPSPGSSSRLGSVVVRQART